MKKIVLLLVSIFTLSQVDAQIQYSTPNTNSTQPIATVDKLSGPRVGLTIISNGGLKDGIEDIFGVSTNVMTQFGYQFEKQMMGDENVAGLIETIILIGGIEQGMFIPSASFLFGARFAKGTEFAIGPNLSFSGAALVFAAGKTIKAGDINIPINVAWVPSTQGSGHRFTATIGFNFRSY